METTKRKRGFTLVELITVIAMLLLLMGAVTSSVSGARRRAKIQQAISEAQELTNAQQDAILPTVSAEKAGAEIAAAAMPT